MYSKIIATGSYLPERILTNHDLEQMVDTTNDWIVERTGIKSRHIVAENETTCDMAYMASLKALQAAQIDANEIDLIIVGTSTQDVALPSTACYLQERLGITITNGSFDMQAACSGFIYALNTADCYIKSGMAKTALVVGVDTLSKVVDYNDRGTCILFGDGAGAVILKSSNEAGILASQINADASYTSILKCDASMDNRKSVTNPYLVMDGQAVFKFAVKALTNVAKDVVHKANYELSDIDWVIPHQANIRIIESTAKLMKVPMSKVVATVEHHGNTSAASIPLALDIAVRDGRVKRNDLILLEGVGAGFTWGATLIRF
jgi:3-oxoacyl-[acyl-carrier-protein] synthase-3